MNILRLPSFFGFIVVGIVLGQESWIKNIVQVEAISRGLGVIFIMFFLGLEFNLSKIRRVWSVSLLGSLILLILTLGCCYIVALSFHGPVTEALVIGECIFLSSTAIVLYSLDSDDIETVYGRNIMGILVTQVSV